jgi:hypothetical protein
MFEGCGARAGLPSEEAAANVTHLRQMLAQQNGWKEAAGGVRQAAGDAYDLTDL